MIIYFADRQLNILGQASTELPNGLTITADRKTEDIDTGVSVFECKIPFDDETRAKVEACTEVGNYLLRKHDGENELYSIIDAEINTKKQIVYIYAEDDGLDLLNEVVGAYEADKAYPITHYISKYASGAGFQVGINEVESLTRKLSWDGEATAAARIASVATQFDGCEISFSFDIDGLYVVKKYINIYKQRGKDIGAQLRLNQDIDSVITTKSIANLATALQCTGGTPEEAEDPITLQGYEYDDGDFYVDGTVVKSRIALEKWRRYLWKTEESQAAGGHITKQYSYDTTSQQTLCAHAITELKKIRDIEVNYEVDIRRLPRNVKIGDRVNVIDDAGELYLSTRILQLETSVCEQEYKAVLGEYLIKGSGISQKVADLAAQFAAVAAAQAKARDEINLNVSEAKTVADGAEARVTVAESTLQQLADAFSLLVTDENGTSLMTPTETGWTFNISEITKTLDTATEDIDNLSGEYDSVSNAVGNLQQAVSDLGVLADYVIITTYNGHPCIELGESENDFKVRITNTEIQFADGTTIPAYVSNQKLNIECARVDELQFGDEEDETIPGVWIWEQRSSGNLGLTWKATVEVVLITFTIAGTSYTAEEGMTWGEWAESDYNTAGASITSDNRIMIGSYVATDYGVGYQYSTDVIVAGTAYVTSA